MAEKPKPSPAESNGRGTNGRFLPGNRAGKGNPMARRVQKLRVALLREVTPDDLTRIVRRLINAALDGDVAAAREILDRTLGRPLEGDILQRIADLESALSERRQWQ